MGITQGNIALLVLSLGQLFMVPLTTFLLNAIWEFIGIGWLEPFLTVVNKDVCNLVPGSTDYTIPTLWVGPSYWVAQVTFFFAFVMMNAGSLYALPAPEGADQTKVDNRKSQALIAMILTGLALVLLLIGRKLTVGCETWLGLAAGVTSTFGLAYFYYFLVKACGGTSVDLFGIVQKILPQNMDQDPPMTCVKQDLPI